MSAALLARLRQSRGLLDIRGVHLIFRQRLFQLGVHAFERLRTIAVEFRTNAFNHASQRAIERLGAKRDGVLRNHMILPDGTYRDSVVYSILESEWPAVRRHLRYLLDRPR